MKINRPSIVIYTVRPNEILLKEVCAGIEEEGVLFEVTPQEESDLDTLIFRAAHDSILGTGIGIYGEDIGFSLRNMLMGEKIFNITKAFRSQARDLGQNAARAVKKMPFKEIKV